MFYNYFCTSCNENWEENQFLNDRDLPTTLPCPHCGEQTVKRGFSTPAISYNGGGLKSNVTRAGSGWNDLLNKIKKGSGKQANINTN